MAAAEQCVKHAEVLPKSSLFPILSETAIHPTMRGAEMRPRFRIASVLLLGAALSCGGGRAGGGGGYTAHITPVFGPGDSGVGMASDVTASAANDGDADSGQAGGDGTSAPLDGAANVEDAAATSDVIAPKDANSAGADIIESDGGPVDGGPPAPTFALIYNEVLVPAGCTSVLCHGTKASSPDQEIFVDPVSAYDKLVNKASNVKACQFLPIVLPGEPFKSVLYKKIAPGLVPCGDKMPIGSDGLAAEQAAMIKAWIEAGAKP